METTDASYSSEEEDQDENEYIQQVKDTEARTGKFYGMIRGKYTKKKFEDCVCEVKKSTGINLSNPPLISQIESAVKILSDKRKENTKLAAALYVLLDHYCKASKGDRFRVKCQIYDFMDQFENA